MSRRYVLSGRVTRSNPGRTGASVLRRMLSQSKCSSCFSRCSKWKRSATGAKDGIGLSFFHLRCHKKHRHRLHQRGGWTQVLRRLWEDGGRRRSGGCLINRRKPGRDQVRCQQAGWVTNAKIFTSGARQQEDSGWAKQTAAQAPIRAPVEE